MIISLNPESLGQPLDELCLSGAQIPGQGNKRTWIETPTEEPPHSPGLSRCPRLYVDSFHQGIVQRELYPSADRKIERKPLPRVRREIKPLGHRVWQRERDEMCASWSCRD